MKPGSYGPFPYSPITRRPRLEWPGGAHVALWIIPNIEYFSLEERPGGYGAGKVPDVVMWSERDYGNRVGVFRIMDVLDRYGMRGTVALNSNLCVEHPQIIEEGNKRRWEWMGHNESNTRRLNEAGPGEEEQIIKRTLATIEQHAGVRPAGWLSAGLQETWDTLDHLAAHGVKYVGDWCNDDQPYVMSLEHGRSMIAMPYTQQLNDKSAIERRFVDADGFRKMICDQFDVLYREGAKSGRVMAIALHPYLIGVPHRIGALDAALKYISKHRKVWKATGSEIANHYLKQLQSGASGEKPARRASGRSSARRKHAAGALR
jgi:allantoinase